MLQVKLSLTIKTDDVTSGRRDLGLHGRFRWHRGEWVNESREMYIYSNIIDGLSSPLGPEPTTPVSPQPSPLSSNKRESARVYHNLVSDCQLEYFLGEDCR